MKVAIVALAAAGLASAQSKACSAGCISLNAQSTGCSSADDVECLCKPQNISRLQSDLTECLASDCSLGYDRALDEVPQIIRDLCGSVASSSSSSSSGSNGGNGGGITATNSGSMTTGSMEATASSTGTASQTGSDATQSTMTGSMSTSMAGATNHTMSNSTTLATKTSSGAPASETESETTSEEPSASPSDGSASQAAIGAFVALAAAALAL